MRAAEAPLEVRQRVSDTIEGKGGGCDRAQAQARSFAHARAAQRGKPHRHARSRQGEQHLGSEKGRGAPARCPIRSSADRGTRAHGRPPVPYGLRVLLVLVLAGALILVLKV
jgi:hypothetical protein